MAGRTTMEASALPFTVKLAVPAMPPFDAEIVVVPGSRPVAKPDGVTLATAMGLLVHVTLLVNIPGGVVAEGASGSELLCLATGQGHGARRDGDGPKNRRPNSE